MAVGQVMVVHKDAAEQRLALLTELMREESYDVMWVALNRFVVNYAVDHNPDVVVIVHELGTFDLSRLCHDLRDAVESRIIVVSDAPQHASQTAAEEAFVVDVLDAGADDLLPITTPERVLAARLRVAMRAMPIRQRRSGAVAVGDVVIDPDAHILSIGGSVVNCPPLQFRLLLALARDAGLVVSRHLLFNELWGVTPTAVDPRRLRIAISVLRGILGHGPRRPVIQTASGIGYRLSAPGAARLESNSRS